MNQFINFVANYWSTIIAVIAVVAVVASAVVKFSKLPNTEQIAKIKACLLAWVIEAERDLGGGTGKVKLSTVYGWFVTSFPVIKNFVSFDTFSTWVDEALVIMEQMLKDNKDLNLLVKKDKE